MARGISLQNAKCDVLTEAGWLRWVSYVTKGRVSLSNRAGQTIWVLPSYRREVTGSSQFTVHTQTLRYEVTGARDRLELWQPNVPP